MRIDCLGLVGLAVVCWIAPACGDDDVSVEVPDGGVAGHDGGGHDAGHKHGGAEADAGSAQTTFHVTATEYMFDPDTLTVEKGETFVVVLRNDGMVNHNIEFDLPDGSVKLDDDLSPGDTAELTVTAPSASGDYDFFCPIPGHRQLGMEGTLTVE